MKMIMEHWIYIMLLALDTRVIKTQVQEFNVKDDCCNGTLGYANSVMPCSALKCCDPRETVTVSLVNAALGYVFRCEKWSEIKSECVPRGDTLISTNEYVQKYGSRVCCSGLKLQIYFNHPSAAFAVECV